MFVKYVLDLFFVEFFDTIVMIVTVLYNLETLLSVYFVTYFLLNVSIVLLWMLLNFNRSQ